jgi:hypothetical protein
MCTRRLAIFTRPRDRQRGGDRLEQARHAAGGHWIARLGAPILAGVTQIGRDGGDARCAGIVQGADEKQQPAELVAGACGGPAMAAVHHVDAGVANALQRTCARRPRNSAPRVPPAAVREPAAMPLPSSAVARGAKSQRRLPPARALPFGAGAQRIAVGAAACLCRRAGRRRVRADRAR